MRYGLSRALQLAWLCGFLLHAASASDSILLRNGLSAQHAEFAGRPRWRLIPYLWTDKAVNVTCKFTTDFKVYTATSLEALSDKVERKESVWCGWRNFLGKHSCIARLSPFGDSQIAVLHDVPTSELCSVDVDEHVSFFMIGQTIAGIALFLNASKLSSSVFFRLGTGSAGVMMLSVIILLFLLSRTLPSKKSAAALFAIFGSSFTGMVRYVFGQWVPSFEQLVYNKVFLAYMAFSGLVGLAVTYYYDREDNVRLHNILKYGLKLVGLVLMAFGTSMPEASVTLCCLLLALELVQPVRFLWSRGEVSSRTLSDLVSESPGAVRRRLSKPRVSLSRFKPPEPSDESGTEPLDTDFDRDEEEEDPEADDPSSEQSSERAFAQASKLPLPGDVTPGSATRHRRSPSGREGVALPLGMDSADSPWLKRGLALNTETGRTVKMGGSTWNRLVLQGYQLDRHQGTFTPPQPSRRRNTDDDTPTPASRVKARRSPN